MYIQIMVILGTFPGLFFQRYFVKKYGKFSIPFIVTGLVIISVSLVTYYNIPSIIYAPMWLRRVSLNFYTGTNSYH